MGTITVERHATSVANPLDEAGTWLRTAVAVPYDSRDSAAWIREFQMCVSSARRALALRSVALRGDRGLPPRLLALGDREAESHEQITRLADELFTGAYMALEPDLLEMVELVESAKELECAIERLRRHRSDLLFESTYRDLGGGG
ncbi:MAG: hypothetical protein WD557_16050 [Dehalococcoidia bacterium]